MTSLERVMTRLTFGSQTFVSPMWSHDGRYVVFGSIGNGLHWARADGGGQPQQLLATKAVALPFSVTPDGRRLAFVQSAGAAQIWTVPIEYSDGPKAGAPERFLTTQFADTSPMISPDGRWLAYESNEQGRPEVFVRTFPAPATGQGGKWQISNSGGTTPLWSADGREILYRSGEQIIAVGYTASGDSFIADKPRVWLSGLRGVQAFDLSPDGKRVITATTGSAGQPMPEHTVMLKQNFFDELRRRVPIDK
jgi:serine/threonine-protein kinase